MATIERLRPPVDLDTLAGRIYERGLGAGPITNVRKLGGGTQHIVLRCVNTLLSGSNDAAARGLGAA
jgi:hypothetical protein